MDKKIKSVLVLDGSSRQILPILQELHELKIDITTLNYSRLDNGYISRYTNERIIEPSAKENIIELQKIIEREIYSGKYDMIIPLSDITTDIVSLHKENYEKYVKTAVPTYDVFLKAYDKQLTMNACMDNDIPCPITRLENQSIDDYLEKVPFPIVIKPRKACGSVGFRVVKSKEELIRIINSKAIFINNYVMQEYIPQTGDQYNVHMFMDDKCNLTMGVVTQKCRWFPIDGGASCFCRTISRRDLISQCTKLLKVIGWRGYCEIELILDPRDGQAKVMEINGRTSASVKICKISGANISNMMIELANGDIVTNYRPYEGDVRMRCIHTDLLWLIKSDKRFKTKPSWFDNRHTYDQIFSLADPLPFFTFSLQSIMQYKKEMNKRVRE